MKYAAKKKAFERHVARCWGVHILPTGVYVKYVGTIQGYTQFSDDLVDIE